MRQGRLSIVKNRYPGWYATAVTVGLSLASVAAVVVVAFVVLQRATDRALEAERRSGELSRRATCQVVIAQNNVYRETPPVSPAGIEAAKAWSGLRQSLRCDN